jgi:hypothetical protein
VTLRKFFDLAHHYYSTVHGPERPFHNGSQSKGDFTVKLLISIDTEKHAVKVLLNMCYYSAKYYEKYIVLFKIMDV